MRALVTGATGFLGSYVVAASKKRGDDVRALVRAGADVRFLRGLGGVELTTGDLGDEGALARATAGVDVVYHSAARVVEHGRRAQFLETNVEGTRRLLEAARRNGVRRFVFVSTPSAVGDGRDHVDVDESSPYPERFVNYYSETKATAERMVLAASTPGFVTCALRPRGLYGPRDRLGLIPAMIDKVVAGRIRDLSGGKPVFISLCYCENAAEACVLAGRSDAVSGKAYFVTDGQSVDLWALLNRIAARFGAPPIRRANPRLAHGLAHAVEGLWRLSGLEATSAPPISRYKVGLLARSSTYSIEAARRDLGYRPVVDGRVAIERLIASHGEAAAAAPASRAAPGSSASSAP